MRFGMILLLASLGTTPAFAEQKTESRRQVELGSRIATRVESRTEATDKTRLVQADYGACVAKKQTAAASNYVITPHFNAADLRRILPKVGDGYCLLTASATFGSQMTFPGDTMRYTLADALVQAEYPSTPALIRDAGPIAHAVLDEADYLPKPGHKPKQSELDDIAMRRQQAQASIYLSHFGECVVRAEPEVSYQLLRSRATSAEENAAFGNLSPALDKCLDQGQSMSLNKAAIRGTIAMNYYRLAHAPRQSAAPAGAAK